MEDLAEPQPRRVSLAAVLAALGAAALAASALLPWFDLRAEDRDGFVFSRGLVDRWAAEAKADGEDGATAARARAWLDGGPLGGWGWIAVVSEAFDHANQRGVEERELRAWRAGIAAARGLPAAAALLAVGLLLARLRRPSSGVLAIAILLGLAAAGLASLLVLGASPAARALVEARPAALGLGGLAFAGGAAALLVAGLVGAARRGGWKPWLAALGLALLGVLCVGIYVAG